MPVSDVPAKKKGVNRNLSRLKRWDGEIDKRRRRPILSFEENPHSARMTNPVVCIRRLLSMLFFKNNVRCENPSIFAAVGWFNTMLRKRFCRICGAVFYVTAKQASRAYCDSEECRQERRRRSLDKEKERYALQKKGVKKVQARERLDTGRRCRRCGKNCYPNYFFCDQCHHFVTFSECWQEEDNEVA
jgi:hypothetical protein